LAKGFSFKFLLFLSGQRPPSNTLSTGRLMDPTSVRRTSCQMEFTFFERFKH